MFSIVIARSNKSATKFIRDLQRPIRVQGRFFSEVANTQRKKLVILGTGWAGFRCLLDVDIEKYDVTVISPRNHFLFTPLLTSTTVGTLEFRGIIEPVRTARKRLNYAQASCTKIDFENQILEAESYYPSKDTDASAEYKPHFQMKYDELVISVGALPNTFKIPGVEKYCFFLKQLSDARAIRQRILECFERASNPTTPIKEKERLLHFVVIGGGPTSVEFTAELHDFLKQDVHKWFPELEPYVKITLVEAGKTLLSSFDAKLSDYTMRLFKKRAIDVRVGVAVKEVTRHVMLLSDGTEVPFGLAVWSTGLAPTSFVNNMPLKKDRSGRIIVDNFCRVKEPSLQNVYAIGDCANFEDFNAPPTAQAAEQEGKYIAKILNDKAHGREMKPFIYQYKGMLAYVGGWRALADLPFFAGSGFLTWLFWNAAYITKLVSLKNKVMIPMYWFKSFVFGRDIARF